MRAPPKAIALLAFLSLRAGEPASRDAVAFALWPDQDEEAARNTLRRHLHRLTHALPSGERWIIADGRRYVAWNTAAPADIDVAAFDADLQRGDDGSATRRYAGDLCDGIDDEWLDQPRERYRALTLSALARLATVARINRRFDDAATVLRRQLELEPFDEEALRALMSARDAAGDRAGAIAEYERFAARLRTELTIEPMPETKARLAAIAAGRAPSLDDASHVRSPSAGTIPFLGRRRELSDFAERWRAIERGTLCIFVSGVAGIGKTRFVEVASLEAERAGARIFRGTTSIPEARPYEAVLRALQGAGALLSADLRRLVDDTWNPQPISNGAFEADTVGCDVLFDRMAAAFAELSATRPIVVILEDLHWAGASTAMLVERLARDRHDGRVALVVTVREGDPGSEHMFSVRRRLTAQGRAHRIALGPLDAADIAAMYEQGAGMEQHAAELLERSGGNPFFLVHALRDGESDSALEQALRLRFDRLPPASRDIATAAAVIGEGFETERLARLVGESEGTALRLLSSLIDARLVREAEPSSGFAYTFTHALLRDAAYELQDMALKRRRHARIALILKEEAVRDPGQAASVARHLDRAESPNDAASWYARAARHAFAVHSDDDAVAFASAGIALTTDRVIRISLLLEREAAYRRSARTADAVADLRELEALAGDDQKVQWEITVRRLLLGFFNFDVALVDAALAGLDAFQLDETRQADAAELRARATALREESLRALELYSEARERRQRLGDARGALRCDISRVILLGLVGDYAAARSLSDEVIVAAKAFDDDVMLDALSYVSMVDTNAIDGRAQARRAADYLAAARRQNNRLHRVYALDIAAIRLATLGQTAEADTLLEELRELIKEDREANYGFWEHSKMVVDVKAGRYDDALMRADRSEALLASAHRRDVLFVCATCRLEVALARENREALSGLLDAMRAIAAQVKNPMAAWSAALLEQRCAALLGNSARVFSIADELRTRFADAQTENRAVLVAAFVTEAFTAVDERDIRRSAACAEAIASGFERDVENGLQDAAAAADAVAQAHGLAGSEKTVIWRRRAVDLLDSACERFADDAAAAAYRALPWHRSIVR